MADPATIAAVATAAAAALSDERTRKTIGWVIAAVLSPLILVVVLVVFGVGKLPEIGGGLGRGIRNFKKEIRGESEEEDPAQKKIDSKDS